MSKKAALLSAVFTLAVTATVAGTAALIDFDTAPGKSTHPPASWPGNTRVPRAWNRKQIVLIAHPQCGCTAATLRELAGTPGAAVSVLFFRPGPDSDWHKGESWKLAERIEGVQAMWDDGGQEAKVFGGSTSGSVLLFGEKGELLFEGGITPARGHAGASLGLSRLEQALKTGLPSLGSTPVFGCSLLTAGTRS